jgi:hypothetical protein
MVSEIFDYENPYYQTQASDIIIAGLVRKE